MLLVGDVSSAKMDAPQYCENLTTYMSDQAGFSDYLVVRYDMVHHYDPKQLELTHACLAEPLTVALDVTLRADLELNDEVVVFGPGPIGLMAVKIANCKVLVESFSWVPIALLPEELIV